LSGISKFLPVSGLFRNAAFEICVLITGRFLIHAPPRMAVMNAKQIQFSYEVT
jgi:hypothetical protein